jgi:lysyl-tRNA synthetase class I
MSRQTEADYLKSDDLGLVIAKGMAVMYKEDPKNPVDFLAKWLLNYSQVEKAALSKQEQSMQVEKNQKAHQDDLAEQAKTEETKKQEAGSKEESQRKFETAVKESKDLQE